jgi:murein DD-endopeptidase MepM/ murein hydrolase activator NlpD
VALAILAVVARGAVVLLVALAAAVLPGAAQAAAVEVHDPGGVVVASASKGRFAYPGNGSLVRVRSVSATRRETVLRGVSLLGGQVRAASIVVPRHGFYGARVTGLTVDGQARTVRANTLVTLGTHGYLVALQEAVAPGSAGLVGLRLHLAGADGTLGPGSDVLLGLPTAPAHHASVRLARAAPAVAASPLALSAVFFAHPGGIGYSYPLAVPGQIIGCPFVPGSTHSPFTWPFNLASDDAVDIAVPIGTPVLAVAPGVIGDLIGPLDSNDPRLQGLRVHLDTGTQRFYYAHLSRIDVRPGQLVQAGQQLGLSGEANGVAHLHFAQDGGNPAVTIGEPQACPYFHQYNEPWG